MNRTGCGLIRSYLTQDIKYHVLYETSAMKMWEILEKKISDEQYRVSTTSKEEALLLPLKKGLSIAEHMNDHTKLLTLVNVDVNIKEEDKTLILLNSLPDKEYETFILTLINGK